MYREELRLRGQKQIERVVLDLSEENKSLEGWAFVKTVDNEQEAAMVESILGTEDIPVQLKHREAGSYMEIYMGMSRYGIDIFVPEAAEELAKGLLNSEMIDMPEETVSEEVKKAEEKYEKKRKSIAWIILMYLFLPLVIGIILKLITGY